MNQNKLFQLTRWRLASWYAGVMGLILSLCGLGVYEAITHAHWVTIDRELESVAGTLHDSIEPLLKQPGRLEPAAQKLLPDLCLVGEPCHNSLSDSGRHTAGALHQGAYYVRLVDLSERLIALAGSQPTGLPATSTEKLWRTLKDAGGNRYRQISLPLHTQNNRDWGYIQVGRSLKDFDDYLAAIGWILFLGLPIAMIAVAGAGWWLAGLAMQPIYRSYQQIQQFTSDAAHELRTPLAAIRATVESVLRMAHLSDCEARDTLRVIERQNHRLSQLVQDLLLLSRMDRETQPPNPKSQIFCCLNDLISDVAEELADLAIAAGVKLTTDIRTDKPVTVVGDEEQLYRLALNLVVNAIQYTPAGGQVTVILERGNHHAMIHVQDTGIGIAPAEQTRIFDRFYRVNSDRSRHTGGSGLGLPIAQAIAQAHQGSIQVSSVLNKGSSFTILLPFR
ncbi:two-component system sensor histidine kinase RppB [Microcoleus sp. FACHB-672]|uniref:two-component system sensor histidine kinase RppB n=1 Tax=Microcoleus sp. FACHB-672 TaxID=2692825 RepID=UPI00168884A7|nr:two-component system sensor histidine kinase RppB [Microcoleus sp. FACHB-672]MBD2041673.1 two-component sensor histidine kinase [Microcoleus sp. FACHB-672]